MASIYKQKFKRTLADGKEKEYESRVFLCRFYAQGRPWRLSTGEEDGQKAQALADTWEKQAREGLPLNPPSPGQERLQNARPAALSLTGVSVHAADDPAIAPFLLTYINARRQLDNSAETVLAEVEQLLVKLAASSGLSKTSGSAH